MKAVLLICSTALSKELFLDTNDQFIVVFFLTPTYVSDEKLKVCLC